MSALVEHLGAQGCEFSVLLDAFPSGNVVSAKRHAGWDEELILVTCDHYAVGWKPEYGEEYATSATDPEGVVGALFLRGMPF